jgi:hypothetical protein
MEASLKQKKTKEGGHEKALFDTVVYFNDQHPANQLWRQESYKDRTVVRTV